MSTNMLPSKKRRRRNEDQNNDDGEGKCIAVDVASVSASNVVARTSELILRILSGSSSSSFPSPSTSSKSVACYNKKELKKLIRETKLKSKQGNIDNNIKKKDIKRALQLLVDQRRIVEVQMHDKTKDNKHKATYRLATESQSNLETVALKTESKSSLFSTKQSDTKMTISTTLPKKQATLSILPIGLRLRQHEGQQQLSSGADESDGGVEDDEDFSSDDEDDEKATDRHSEQKWTKKESKQVQFAGVDDDLEGLDLDDEIARLERELAAQNESDDDEDSESQHQADESAILSLSKFANDHVEHLPPTSLPVPSSSSRRKSSGGGNIGGGDVDVTSKAVGMTTKTRQNQASTSPATNNNSGLQKAVQEVLQGYTARSADRLPFYCRFCAKQYSNETEFFDHKRTEFHLAAVEAERKMTYCKLCRKQLTSPAQMKEHLKSKPHKQRLDMMRNKHRSVGTRAVK